MKTKININTRFDSFQKYSLYQSLDNKSKNEIKDIGIEYKLTFQELKQLTDMAVDFQMWEEPGIGIQWKQYSKSFNQSNKIYNKTVLKSIKNNWQLLKENETKYNPKNKRNYSSSVRKLKEINGDNDVFGMCPVASEKTVCCNLRTIDVAQGCGLGCSYCSIQTFYENGSIAVEKNLKDKLAAIELDPNKNYHIGSGQSSDSLALGNKNGILDSQLEFASNNPNIILEFKTKSKNVNHFLDVNMPNNIFVSWSLNPQLFIDNEEARTASLMQRLKSARKLSDKGILIGFHFHPIVHYEGWEKDYKELINNLMAMFSPSEIGLISFGTLTFIKPAIKSLREVGTKSKILQIPFAEAAGKISYPMQTKKKIFSEVWGSFTPWHDKVFFYLCMEDRELWNHVFGKCYESNDDFEIDLFDSVKRKLELKTPINVS
jgi:spore photoproduct lyase